MDPNEALKMLDGAVAQLHLHRAAHIDLAKAVQVLGTALDDLATYRQQAKAVAAAPPTQPT